MKKAIFIGSFILIMLGITFPLGNNNNFLLGDYILSKAGFNTWSNGTEGLHYSAIITLILLVLGFTGVLVFKRNVNRRFIVFLVGSMFFGSLILQPIFNFTYGIVKSNCKGLSTVEFIRKGSDLTFKSDEQNSRILFDGQIKFKNYSNERKEFYIKILPNETLREIAGDNEIIISDEQNKPIKYTAEPKSKESINAKFIAKRNSGVSGSGGSINMFDLVIFNENDEEQFIKGIY